MNRIIFHPDEQADEGAVVLAGRRAQHIRNVLQPEPGARLRVGILEGPLGEAIVEQCDDEQVVLRCRFDSYTPARPCVSLLLALPRPKVMKRLWAPLAAMGVDRILLTNACRVERNYFDTHVLDPGFYRMHLIEGLEQAGDTRLPEVQVHRRFNVLAEDQLDAQFPAATRVLADPGVGASMTRVAEGAGQVLLAVGPEGGWVDYERDLLQAHRFQPVSMGARSLRTDTACIALLALAHDTLSRG